MRPPQREEVGTRPEESDQGVGALGGSRTRDCVKGVQEERRAPGEVMWWATQTQPNTKRFKYIPFSLARLSALFTV